MEKLIIAVFAFLLIVGIYSLFFGLGVLLLVWAWNSFMVSVFGLPAISFIQGLALSLLLGATKSTVHVMRNS